MERSLDLARDVATGKVIARELAERCALAFGVAGRDGPLEDRAHWLHALAEEVAAEAQPLGDLLVVRMRAQGRTYWMIADAHATRTYAPHISQRDAVARFEAETDRRHARIVLHREQHKPAAAAELLARTFGGAA